MKQYGKRTLENYLHRSEFELYDMVSDQDEINNLADDPNYEAVLIELKEKIRAFQIRTRDPWIIIWSNESMFQDTGVNL